MSMKHQMTQLLLSLLLLTGCAPVQTPTAPTTATPDGFCTAKLSPFNPSDDVYLSGTVDFCPNESMTSFDFDHGILASIDENPSADVWLTVGGSQKVDVTFLAYLNQVHEAYIHQVYDTRPASPGECKKMIAASVYTTFVQVTGVGAVGCVLTNEGRLGVFHVEKTGVSGQGIEISFLVWKVPASSIPPAMPTLTPSPVPANTPTSAFGPSDLLKNQCIEISPNLPAQIETQGLIVLDGKTPSLFNPKTGSKKSLENSGWGDYTVSPDHQWLAYTFQDSHEKQWLAVETASGKQRKTLAWEENWYQLGGWLNNQDVWITYYGETDLDVMQVNPFTGKYRPLEGNFPNMKGIPSRYYNPLKHTRIRYNASLNLAIYPILEKKDEYSLALRDMQTGRVAAKIRHVFKGPSSKPVWSADGTQVYVIESPDDKLGGDNIFSLSQDGQVQQITHFGDMLDSASMFGLNMSPDGKKIAFWLSLGPSFPWDQSLAILDLETGRVTNYCGVTGPSKETGGISEDAVWSPDNRFLAIAHWYGEESVEAVLLDTQQNWAAQIAKRAIPVGWMLEDVSP